MNFIYKEWMCIHKIIESSIRENINKLYLPQSNKVNKFVTVFALAQSHLPGPVPGGQTRTAPLLFIK